MNKKTKNKSKWMKGFILTPSKPLDDLALSQKIARNEIFSAIREKRARRTLE